jgi:hypothetical protein
MDHHDTSVPVPLFSAALISIAGTGVRISSQVLTRTGSRQAAASDDWPKCGAYFIRDS